MDDSRYMIEMEIQHEKNKQILDFEPMFEEIKIISETFFLLQAVINYKSTSLDANANSADSILHFAYARKTFKQLNNSYGQIISLINLGFYQLKQEFSEQSITKEERFNSIIETFDLAQQYALNDLGLNHFQEFKMRFLEGRIKINSEQDQIILNCINQIIILKGRLMKETAFQIQNSHYLKKECCDSMADYIECSEKYNSMMKKSLSLLSFAATILEQVRDIASATDLKNNEQELIMLRLDIFEIQIILSNYNNVDLDIFRITSESPFEVALKASNIDKQAYLQNFQSQFASKMCESLVDGQNPNTISGFAKTSNQATYECSQVINVISSRLSYLKALIYFKQNQFQLASSSLTEIFESCFFLDDQLKLKSLLMIHQICQMASIPHQIITKHINKLRNPPNYDIIIFIEGNSFDISPAGQLFLTLNDLKQKFIQKNDRISFFTFNNDLIRSVSPLIQIKTQKLWEITMSNLFRSLYTFNITTEFIIESETQLKADEQTLKPDFDNEILSAALDQISQANILNNKNTKQNYQNDHQNQIDCNDEPQLDRQALVIIISSNEQLSINKKFNNPDYVNMIQQQLSKLPLKVKILHTLADLYGRHRMDLEMPNYVNSNRNKKANKIYQFTNLNQLKSFLIIKRQSK